MDIGKLVIGGLSASFIGLVCVYAIPKMIIRKLNMRFDNIEFFISDDCSNNQICLTLDDAPYGKSYGDILDTLEKYDVKVTFFVISDYVNDDNKHLMLKALKNGHQLANHGKTNTKHASLSFEELKKEIEHCQNLIEILYEDASIEMPECIYYRPGCGFFNNTMFLLQEENNMKIILGSVYPHDPQIPSSTINYYYLINKVESNDIIILHDRTWTVDLLKYFIPQMINKDLKFKTLSQTIK
jgi:peptidoglycan/xylan/chitin deacetylase (PgdA/CDA1 family)